MSTRRTKTPAERKSADALARAEATLARAVEIAAKKLVEAQGEASTKVIDTAKAVAEQTVNAAALAALSTAATTAAQAVVKEFISGPGLVQVINQTVNATLDGLGVDTKKPEETRKDLMALRDWRETITLVRRKGLMTVVVSLVSLFMMAIGLGFGVLLTRPTP